VARLTAILLLLQVGPLSFTRPFALDPKNDSAVSFDHTSTPRTTPAVEENAVLSRRTRRRWSTGSKTRQAVIYRKIIMIGKNAPSITSRPKRNHEPPALPAVSLPVKELR